MKIKVSKPVGGKVTIDVNDRDGATGTRTTLRGVEVKALRDTLKPVVELWQERRAAIVAERRKART